MSDISPEVSALTLVLDESEPLFAWLVSLDPPSRGALVAVPWEGLTFGAAPSNDIILSDSTVSPIHARIHIIDDNGQPCCQLQDMASSYGSFVDGVRIVRHNLADNDLIKLGQTRFCFKQLPSGS